jgi:hypothetical protein
MQCPHCGKRLSDKWILEMAGKITGNRIAKERKRSISGSFKRNEKHGRRSPKEDIAA